MYKVIKAASASAQDSAGIKENIRALRSDLRILYKSETEADILENEDRFQCINPTYSLDRYAKQGMDISEIIEQMIDNVEGMLDHYKQKLAEVQDLEPKMKDTSDFIYSTLENAGYDVKYVDDGKIYVYPDSLDHSEVDNIANEVCRITRGKFNGTMPGGSWTTLNLRSGDGVPINVGWSNSNISWAPKKSIYIEVVYHN